MTSRQPRPIVRAFWGGRHGSDGTSNVSPRREYQRSQARKDASADRRHWVGGRVSIVTVSSSNSIVARTLVIPDYAGQLFEFGDGGSGGSTPCKHRLSAQARGAIHTDVSATRGCGPARFSTKRPRRLQAPGCFCKDRQPGHKRPRQQETGFGTSCLRSCSPVQMAGWRVAITTPKRRARPLALILHPHPAARRHDEQPHRLRDVPVVPAAWLPP